MVRCKLCGKPIVGNQRTITVQFGSKYAKHYPAHWDCGTKIARQKFAEQEQNWQEWYKDNVPDPGYYTSKWKELKKNGGK